jgi:Homeodomain-like domain
MHASAVRTAALKLMREGLNDCEIGRRLGLPRTTVRDWRRPRYIRQPAPEPCERCWNPMTAVSFTPDDYAELLGLYLGDGCIAAGPRTERLRLSLDARHALIVEEAAALLTRCFPANRVGRVRADRGSTVVLSVYHGHLSCLLPQHGPGKKHLRRIVVEPWQRKILGAAPWAFLRGCIRSDGCVFVNRTGPYEYLSYEFANFSPEILDLFVETCQSLGLRPRRYTRHARLNRRGDVAELVAHVGLKR